MQIRLIVLYIWSKNLLWILFNVSKSMKLYKIVYKSRVHNKSKHKRFWNFMFTDVGCNFTPKQSDKWENISTLNFKIRDCISDCFKVPKMILRVVVQRGLIIFQVIYLHLHTECFEGQKFISANPKYVFLLIDLRWTNCYWKLCLWYIICKYLTIHIIRHTDKNDIFQQNTQSFTL